MNLDALLKSIDPKKMEQLKQKAEAGQLSEMLGSVDQQKAQQMIQEMGLSEQAKNVDIGKLLHEVKKNPNLIAELKKIF